MENSERQENPDETKLVEEIRKAETEAERIRIEAKEKADQILKNAKDTVTKMARETEEYSTKTKNQMLHEGREGIEADVESIIKKARKEADVLCRLQLSPVNKKILVKKFLEKI